MWNCSFLRVVARRAICSCFLEHPHFPPSYPPGWSHFEKPLKKLWQALTAKSNGVTLPSLFYHAVVNISNVRSNGVYSESFVLWQWPGKVCFQKSMKKSPKTFEEQNKSFKVTWLRPLFSHEKKNCTWEYFYLSLHHSVTFVFIFLSPEEWKWATHFTSKIDLPQNAVDLQFWWNWTQPSSGI